jgi:hypothetical protein
MEKEKGGGEGGREGGEGYIIEKGKRKECWPPHEYMSM